MNKSSVTLLDCTLRDGGYVNNHGFTLPQALGIVEALANSGIDVIEVGYLRDQPPNAECGIAAWCPDAYLAALPRETASAFAVMVRPGNSTTVDIARLRGTPVGWVRIPISADTLAPGLDMARATHEAGLKVCLNIIRASELGTEALDALIAAITPVQPEVIYLADSNGALFPDEMRRLIRMARAACPAPVGCHSHDGLHFSVANAWIAIQEGAEWVDASIGGLGKGGGNAPTEVLLALLNRLEGRPIRLSPLLQAINNCEPGLFPPRFHDRLGSAIYSLLNLNIDSIVTAKARFGTAADAIDRVLLHKAS